MDKAQIRQFIRNISHSISNNEKILTSQRVFETLIELQQLHDSLRIALYYNLTDEVSTREWFAPLLKMGFKLYLPRVEGDEMEFYEYHEDELKEGSYGVIEPTGDEPLDPSLIDLMILPGVAFCRDGRRLGRGKGYYDRYLARSGYRAYNIGIGFSHQLIDDIPTEAHDKRLDRIIAPLVTSPIPKIIRQAVESAWVDADKLGCGIERLGSIGHSWVLIRFKMQLSRTPNEEEELHIETWVSDCSRVMTTRNFTITTKSGEPLGEAISQWCMINIETRRPADLTHNAINYPQFVTQRDSQIKIAGKLHPLDTESISTKTYEHLATSEDIDFNNHVNTFKYIEMMLRALPHHTLMHRGESQIDIQFVHESLLGEKLKITTANIESEHHFEISRPDGSCSMRAVMKF